MSGVRDFIFGDPNDTTGIERTEADNRRRQEFIEEQAALGRRDVLDIIPRGEEALQQGYRAAIDVSRRAPMSQIKTLSRASQRGQEALLGGMDEYKRAIMGMPTRMNENGNFYANPLGLRPQAIGMGADPGNAFYASQQPLFLGSQEQDLQEMAMRRNNPNDFWQLASPNKDVNLFPEQFREPVRYDFRARQTTGGADSAPNHFAGGSMGGPVGETAGVMPPDLYNQALGGRLNFPWGQGLTPGWSGI